MTEGAVTEPAPVAPPLGRRSPRQVDRYHDDLVVVAIFVAAQILFIAVLGVRMDLLFLTFAPHVPDLGLLQHHLLQTVFYEHTQPPGFPFLVGALLQASPFPDGITFQVVWLGFGLATAVVLRRIGRMMGLGRVATFVAIALVVTNPALVSIEFSANYDQPTILLLALLVLFIGRYVSSGSTRHLAAITGIGAAMVLIRTVFHPAWYLLLLAGLATMRQPSWRGRRVLVALVLPGLAIAAFVLKNDVLYGEANLTSWGGPSLSKIAGSAARPAERDRLIADGTVSPLFGRPVFIVGYDKYADAVPPCRPAHPDVPVLADPYRPSAPSFDPSGKGSPNLNYECFLPVYRRQGRDAIAYMRKEPGKFFGAQFTGVQFFFEPALPIVFTPHNLRALHGADTAYSWTLFPRVLLKPAAHSEWGGLRDLVNGGIYLLPTIVLLDLAAVALAVPAIRRLIRQRRRTGGGRRRRGLAAQAAIGLTCGWVTVIGSAFEINENARYRLLIEPFLLLILAWAGEVVWRAVNRR
ncbi:MAG: hypothetical protein ACR2MB_12785, partial [Acidimicrobiales bacterium]